ncbi:hypothetical protein CTA1_10319 [Colletotrichum tanaceti]|uniref:Uncharacterized protein n=1 Tax=Colletotrichum tanaceti TaxID=1306861 RepID=A0A4U6X8Y0_9PEZI|nr:hypothetical protein CTA1_10319 [Colletotrichum tanaceti]
MVDTATTNVPPAVNNSVNMDEESQLLEHAIVVHDKPHEKFFFLKRMKNNRPRLDVLFRIGQGFLHPGAHESEDYAVWEASDSLYLYRTTGPNLQILQSVASVEYTAKNSQVSRIKTEFSLKTCGIIGTRDSEGRLQILKTAISGTEFIPVRAQDRQDFLFDAKWAARVKLLAKLLQINLRTPFDGHGKSISDGNEENVVLGGSVPVRAPTKKIDKGRRQGERERSSSLDSEAQELNMFIDGADQQPNIVFDGYEEAEQRRKSRSAGLQDEDQSDSQRAISPRSKRRFKSSLKQFRRPIIKPIPPTPVTKDPSERVPSQSHYWEDPWSRSPSARPLTGRERRSVALENAKSRRAHKSEVRRQREVATADGEATQQSAGMSLL